MFPSRYEGAYGASISPCRTRRFVASVRRNDSGWAGTSLISHHKHHQPSQWSGEHGKYPTTHASGEKVVPWKHLSMRFWKKGMSATHSRRQARSTPGKGGWHGVLGKVPRAERKREGQGHISLAPEDEHTTGTTPTGYFSRTSTQQRQRLEVIQHIASLSFSGQSSHEDDRTNVS